MGRQREGAQGTSVGWDSVPCHRVASRARDNGFPSKTGKKATKKKGSLKRGGWMPQPVRNFQPHRGILPCSQSPEKTGREPRVPTCKLNPINSCLTRERWSEGRPAWASRGDSRRSVSQSGMPVIKALRFPAPGSYLGGDYWCREAWTSDSLLQLGVPIFCARWYRSESPK